MTVKSVLRTLREILINIALPYLIYTLVQPRYGNVAGLLASSAPPILWSIFEFLQNRRVDALSLLVLFGIALSIAAFFGGGSVRFLQLREKLATAVVAFLFLGSAAIGRPLMYEIIRAFLARKEDKTELQEIESLRDNKNFRRVTMVMTLVWGFGLLVDALVSIALVYVLPIKTYLIVNPVLGYVTVGSLSLWNVLYGRMLRRRAAAATSAPAGLPASQIRS